MSIPDMAEPLIPSDRDVEDFAQFITRDDKIAQYALIAAGFGPIAESLLDGECKECTCDVCQGLRGFLTGLASMMGLHP